MSNLNMPLSVLRPELTVEHKAKLAQLGFNEINMSVVGEVSLLLTDNGAGKGERAWTVGIPASLIKKSNTQWVRVQSLIL